MSPTRRRRLSVGWPISRMVSGEGVDVEARLPLLSTYRGHGNPSSTYWYVEAVPELLALAAERRDRAQGARP